MKIAIIGAGAVGATAAVHLAANHDVTLFEAGTVAEGATGRAAGLVYDAYADSVDANLAQESVGVFRAGNAAGGFSFTACPYVWFATEQGDVATAIKRQVPRMQSHGLDVDRIDPSTLSSRFPDLSTEDIEVAAIANNAGYLTPSAYATWQIRRATDAGVCLREDTSVTISSDPPRIHTDEDTIPVDAIAVAAGAHTGQLIEQAGHQLPVAPYRVQALTTDGTGQQLPMLFDATAEIYTRPHAVGLLVGDGTIPQPVDPNEYDRTGDEWFSTETREYLATRVAKPGSLERSWAGLCTATPDGDPLLGPVTHGVTVATGWQGHGLMRAPATGRILARATVDETAPIPAFDPRRFAGTEHVDIVPGMRIE